MTRAVPPELQSHLDGAATTTCRLLKIKSRAGTVFGLTTLDVPVTYDDGDGEVTYSATRGFDPTALSADVGASVDNAEGMALLSGTVEGVTPQMVEAGEFDDAEWVMYLVNYNDLTTGRHVILGGGDLGEIRMRYGMMWIPELLDISVRLKQPIGCSTSRTCRAVFGTPATEEFGQRGCGVDVEPLWASGTVQSVGAEPTRTFVGDVAPSVPAAPVPQTLVNPGFEDGDLTGWTPDDPSHWPVTTSTPYQGGYNVEFEVSGESVGMLETTAYVAATPGQAATASCFVLPREEFSNRANGRVALAWYDGTDALLSEDVAPWLGTSIPDPSTGAGNGAGNSWRRSVVSGVAPAGTERARVRLYGWLNGSFEPHFDSVSLTFATLEPPVGVSTYPARLQFLTGDNAGRQYSIEVVDGLEISLTETTAYPIQDGDTYRVRADCAKRYVEDCINAWGNGPNFKGGPHMPDGSEVAAPR